MNSRSKGCRGELEWAKVLRSFGIEARRGQQYSGNPDSPDVVSDIDEWFHAEVKRVESLNIGRAVDKAVEDCGPSRVPYVAHRKNHKPWLVTMKADDLIPLLQAAVAAGWRPNEAV